MKENSFIFHWARRVIAWYGLDGRSVKARWPSMSISSVYRCQQMPTKLSISDGNFSAIS